MQKAINSGILNNTNRSHEFVDLVARISADKGIEFDFTNNQRLKESGFSVEGATVNGYTQNGKVTINTGSQKYLNAVVGHEVMHVLEGSEFASELTAAAIEFAKAKDEYDSRYNAIVKAYANVEGFDVNNADSVNAELVADLVGDYLFTDSKFLKSLSAEKPKLFKWLWDEIKYFVKSFTANTPEAKELVKLEKAFAKAYKDTKKASESGEVKYSVATENTEVLGLIQKVKSGEYKANEKVYFDNVSDELAVKIKAITGIDVTGFRVAIEARQIDHILKRHGEHGAADHSMANDSDIAKMEFAIKNADDITKAGKTQAYSYMKDGKNKTADTILYEKNLGKKSYYVVQAVPDANAKTLYIVSAYIGNSSIEKGVSQLIDAKIPNVTPDNGSVVTPNNRISQDEQVVNNKFSLSEENASATSAPDAWNIKGEDVALAPIGENVKRKSAENAKKAVTAPIGDNVKRTSDEGTKKEVTAPIGENVKRVSTEKKESGITAPIGENVVRKTDGTTASYKTTKEEIDAYIDQAANKQNSTDHLNYAPPSARLIEDVQGEIDISDYTHTLRDNDIRHIYNSHGEATNEKYPITPDDIKEIPSIVQNYDKIFVVKRAGSGGNTGNRTGIIYVKVNADNTVYYLEQVTDQYHGEKLLVNKQMIKVGIGDIPHLKGLEDAITKKQSKSQYLADLDQVRKVYVQDATDSYSNKSIAQNTPIVNTQSEKALAPIGENVVRTSTDGVKKEVTAPIGENVKRVSTEKKESGITAPIGENVKRVSTEKKESGITAPIGENVKRVSTDAQGGVGRKVVLDSQSELYKEVKTSGRSPSAVIRDYIVQHFMGKPITFKDGRVAIVDKTDAKELAKQAGKVKTAEISKLQEIIDNADVYKADVEAEHNKFKSFTYYKTTVEMDGKTFDILLNVGLGKFDGKNHLYAITDFNKNRVTAGNDSLAGSVDDLLKSGDSTISIPDAEQNVKGEGEKSTPIVSKVWNRLRSEQKGQSKILVKNVENILYFE